MAAAVIAAQKANSNSSPFEPSSPGRSDPRLKDVKRSASGKILEDLAEVLPPKAFWVRDIELKKLSHKGKWEDRHLVVTSEKVFIARAGRVLEAIPLEEIRCVSAIQPQNSQSSATELGRGQHQHREEDAGQDSARPTPPSHQSVPRPTGNRSKYLTMMSFSSTNDNNSVHPETEQIFEADASVGGLCFEIETFETGEYAGRSYIFSCENPEERSDVISFLNASAAEMAKRLRHKTMLGRWRAKTKAVYESFPLQIFVALLIVAAFVIQVWESETFPEEGSTAREVIDTADVLLTCIFTLELMVNMFSNWFLPFIEDGWNYFDMIVVSVSIVSLSLSSVPGLGALRLMRTFRVLRLFGRLHSFRRIIAALGAALLPVTNAFIVVMLMVSVFAIMGVFLFQNRAPQYFGSFSVSFFTMFTISTVDGWVDVVYDAAPDTLDLGRLYFIAYIIVVVWTLLPVVVAVLLDKFTEVMAKDKERMRRARMPAFKPVTSSALDPILKTLTDFESDDNLSQRIRLLFEALDFEARGSLTHFGVTEALRTLRIGSGVRVSEEDWEDLTQNGRLCDAFGGLSAATFERIVRTELRDFLQRGLAGEILKCEEHSMSAPILSCLKLLLLRDDASSDSSRINLVSPLTSPLAAFDAPPHHAKARYHGAPHGPKSDRLLSIRDRGSGMSSGSVEVASIRSLPGQVTDWGPQAPSIPIEPVKEGLATEEDGVDESGGAREREREQGDVAGSVRRLETLLVNVLKGQERLEHKVDKLEGEVARLGRGPPANLKSAGSPTSIKARATVTVPVASDMAGQVSCDICQDEPATCKVGRANACQLCASLLTDAAGDASV